MDAKYPDVTVQLTGNDGNAFSIIARVRKALARAGASSDELNEFMAEATSSDYDGLLQTCVQWVNVE